MNARRLRGRHGDDLGALEDGDVDRGMRIDDGLGQDAQTSTGIHDTFVAAKC
jgi:hypothetical protein